MPAYRAALEAAREDAGETAETLADVALWYIGARVAGIRSRRPPQSKPAPALPAPVAFDVSKVADGAPRARRRRCPTRARACSRPASASRP